MSTTELIEFPEIPLAPFDDSVAACELSIRRVDHLTRLIEAADEALKRGDFARHNILALVARALVRRWFP